MIFIYILMVGIALFALGVSGMAASKHLIVIIAAAEVALAATTIVALSNFGLSDSSGLISFLFVVWAVGASEVMVLVAFYRYLSKERLSLDISKLSELGDR
jgi:NADH:ubiquinone oxidoreductase subunit K